MSFVIAFVVGILSWSFAEYAVHNWLFHGPRKRLPYNAEHLDHHARQSYFAPNWKKAIIAAIAAVVLGVPAGLLLGPVGLAWTAGLVLFYGVYEMVHRRCHTHAPRGPYSRFIRRHHFHHHFQAPTKNHGVTSPIWDFVFRTYEKPAVITVPERQIMDWLRNPETDEVYDAFAGDYRIAWGRASRELRKKAA
jgi:4-hydroxysphinganine ceramide fatty acyl 2-hydroxylase